MFERSKIVSRFKGELQITPPFFSDGQISTRIIADYKGSITRTVLNKLPRDALYILRLRCDIYVRTAKNLSRHSKLKRMAG
jgi:hypothetical protein